MNETVNLHLPQFEATDRIHHDDFNEAFQAIDAAMSDKIYYGSYVGDGEENRSVQLPFAPRLLLVFGHYIDHYEEARLLIGTQDVTYCVSDEGVYVSSLDYYGILSGDQFCMGNNPRGNNYLGKTVYYVAVK